MEHTLDDSSQLCIVSDCSAPSSFKAVLSEDVYWFFFTRTTLFTTCTLFTVIIFVCSLKSIRILGFVLIGCCISELHAAFISPLYESTKVQTLGAH